MLADESSFVAMARLPPEGPSAKEKKHGAVLSSI
jgi:hypothetical protein